jgi:hypothetical protein
MATCPRCGRFLDEHHRCTGLWRRRARRVGVAVAGALIAVFVPFAFPGYGASPVASVVAALLGALIASAIWSAVP